MVGLVLSRVPGFLMHMYFTKSITVGVSCYNVHGSSCYIETVILHGI